MGTGELIILQSSYNLECTRCYVSNYYINQTISFPQILHISLTKSRVSIHNPLHWWFLFKGVWSKYLELNIWGSNWASATETDPQPLLFSGHLQWDWKYRNAILEGF